MCRLRGTLFESTTPVRYYTQLSCLLLYFEHQGIHLHYTPLYSTLLCSVLLCLTLTYPNLPKPTPPHPTLPYPTVPYPTLLLFEHTIESLLKIALQALSVFPL